MKKLSRQRGQLAAAVCLALGLGSAQAAINPGTQAEGVSGEMFLRVFDVGNATTYAIDLGTTVKDFVDTVASSSYTWSLGPKWAGFAANATGELQFNLGGFSQYTALRLLSPYYGVLVSELNTQDLIDADPRQVQTGQLSGGTLGVKDAATRINNLLPSTPTGNRTNYAKNEDVVSTSSLAWSTNVGINQWQATASVNVAGQADETLNMIWWHGVSGPGADQSQIALFERQAGYMSLNIADGTLNWNAVTAVPLPGAAWMFLGGLLSLLRFTNRARHAVQA